MKGAEKNSLKLQKSRDSRCHHIWHKRRWSGERALIGHSKYLHAKLVCCSSVDPQSQCVNWILDQLSIIVYITWVKTGRHTQKLHSAVMFYSLFMWGTLKVHVYIVLPHFTPCVDHIVSIIRKWFTLCQTRCHYTRYKSPSNIPTIFKVDTPQILWPFSDIFF